MQIKEKTTLYFDDYRSVSEYPPDGKKWVDDGADLNEWRTPQFARDLAELKRGKSIASPVDGRRIQPSEFIVIEEPMGRGRAEMAESIDFVVCIDTPLEIALARNLLQNLEGFSLENMKKSTKEELLQGAEEAVEGLRGLLNNYINTGRALYIAVQEQVERDCDLILDGTKSVDVQAEEVVQATKLEGAGTS